MLHNGKKMLFSSTKSAHSHELRKWFSVNTGAKDLVLKDLEANILYEISPEAG